MPKYNVADRQNRRQDLEITLKDYAAASDAGLSLSEHLSRTYPDVDASQGTVLEQAMASAGLFLRQDAETGLRPPTMKEVLNGGASLDTAAVRGDGSERHDPAGRLLFPEVVMQAIKSELTEDNSDFIGGFNSMVATTANVTSPRFDQPVINTTGPEGSESQPISQNTEPAVMVNITVANRSYRIPTKAIGLQISDEAMAASSLDLVNLAMTAQFRAERVREVEDQISAMVNGDTDWGESALSSSQAKSLDSTISTAGTITQKAWVKYLRNDYRKRSLGALIMDLDTAMAIEARSGRPTTNDDPPSAQFIDTLFTIQNLGLPSPKVLLVEPSVVGANTVVGLDTRYAIRQVINVAASYSAIEQFVMRRSTGFRIDHGSMAHKLYPDAWSVMTLTV